VSALGWLSAAAPARDLTIAQRGVFAPDGIIAGSSRSPPSICILALAATLSRSWQATADTSFETGAQTCNPGSA
jgi:hypothetical protein